jgi:dihydrofolate reductase
VRKLIVSEFLTLDGVMQGPGHPDEDRSGGFEYGGWQTFMDEEQMRQVGEAIAATDAYLLGRKTYEIFAAYWPHQPDSDPFARTLNGLPKHVVSTTLGEPLAWQNSMLISDDVPGAVARLKEQPGKNISVLGSGRLVQTLLLHDLVDELVLMIDPIVLGTGKRLFREGLSPIGLELVDSKVASNGVLTLSYRPAGDPFATREGRMAAATSA